MSVGHRLCWHTRQQSGQPEFSLFMLVKDVSPEGEEVLGSASILPRRDTLKKLHAKSQTCHRTAPILLELSSERFLHLKPQSAAPAEPVPHSSDQDVVKNLKTKTPWVLKALSCPAPEGAVNCRASQLQRA